MKVFNSSILCAAAFVTSVRGLPLISNTMSEGPIEARDGAGQPFECTNPPASDVKTRKETLLSEGATVTDLAIGMQENGCALSAVYSIGGKYPDGTPKTGDAAEIGLFRNNWGMIRQNCDGFIGSTADEWQSKGQALHNNDAMAIKCQQQSISKLTLNGFFAQQRGGSSQVGGGSEYASAIQSVYEPFLQNHLHDGMATYYNMQSQ